MNIDKYSKESIKELADSARDSIETQNLHNILKQIEHNAELGLYNLPVTAISSKNIEVLLLLGYEVEAIKPIFNFYPSTEALKIYSIKWDK